MTLLEIAVTVRTTEKLLITLPPLDEVIARMEQHELDCELRGIPVPHQAVRDLKPVFQAAAEFQKKCLALRAEFAQRHTSQSQPEITFG